MIKKKEGSHLIEELISTINVEKGLSENTKIAYKNDLKLMISWFANQGINFIDANELDLRQLFAFLKKENLKLKSLSRKLSSIKRFYQFLKEENYIKVKSPWNPELINTLHKVTLTDIDNDGLVRFEFV